MEDLNAYLALTVNYGYGYGDSGSFGYDNGSGHGKGSCYGSGCGGSDGMSYGDGCNAGCGSSYGHGDGYGHGEGFGYLYGEGNGYGYGSGIKTFCGNAVCLIDGVQTIIKRLHGSYAKGFILRSDLTLAPCYVVKYDDYFFGHGKTLGEAREAAFTKAMGDMPVEDRVAVFWKSHNRTDRYPVSDFFEWHNRLTGSCEMGRKEFAREHEIDLENGEMTVDEFIKLTENAYGGEIIRKLKEET